LNNNVKYDEANLVTLLQQNDVVAFKHLYHNYNKAIQLIVSQIIQDNHAVEDIVQQAFITYWQKINLYNPAKGRLFTWMLNIARNLSIDYTRSKAFKKSKQIVNSENVVYDSMWLQPEYNAIGLQKYIAQLKPDWQEVIIQSYLQGYTHDEISNNLNIPVGTIKTRLRAAILHLRKLMVEN
jgi:RNA polymerase sigma factor (sigma-70 family)